jgi:hypothetical protein
MKIALNALEATLKENEELIAALTKEKEEMKRVIESSQSEALNVKLNNDDLHMELDRLRGQIGKDIPKVSSSSNLGENQGIDELRKELEVERRRIRYLESEKQSLLN